MAGQSSGGQVLTPNPNVFAPAGFGGGIWGANGGDQNAMGGSKPIAATLCDGETATNYIPSALPVTAKGPITRTVLGQENGAIISGQTLDSSLASGGSNAG